MHIVSADQPEPPIGALVQDHNGNEHTRTPMGWLDKGIHSKYARTFVGSWAEFLRCYGPVDWNGSVKSVD